ncbi:unnamed protein product [Cuscuta campestris]|uniref:Bifunctional inhibitor/plant lipid transfer protein/seed storage helical domain-containing protein n=1 Tax=Cuscuta campestris TaxID=132261 RepID=A0A484KPP2_9ASTE|nr:unnamed protein product [Cuscuta campestris]
MTTATKTTILLLLLLAAATEAQSPAASPAPATAEDCMTHLLDMSDCLTYVEAGSNLTKPEKACCPELSGLVNSHPECLCRLLADPNSTIGIAIELHKALNLPSVCKIDSISPSLCSLIGIQVGGAPAPAPTKGSKTSSSGQPQPGATSPTSVGDGGLASSPSVGKGGSAAAAPRGPFGFHHSLFLAAFVFFASFL